MAGKRILVIDDEQAFCEMMKELLTSERFEVDYSAHPIVATERALSGDYDLITLELNLEDFDGSDVWSLYCDSDVPTPVVVISGYLNEDTRQALKEAGVNYMLEKPFRKSELMNLMQEVVGN